MGKVAKAIAAHHQQFINFPTPNETPLAKYKFSQIGGLPGVIGTIDCTHIEICCQGGPNSELYRNRKGYFSVNVQILFLGGGDLFMIRGYFETAGENHDYNSILLGDSGYALKPYLLTLS